MKSTAPRYYAQILYALVKDASEKDLARRISAFVDFMHKERVISKADAIIDAFLRYADEEDGIQRLTITSVHHLSKETVNTIVKGLRADEVKIDSTIDSGLLGGALIRIKDTVFDASIRGQLKRLHAHLIH